MIHVDHLKAGEVYAIDGKRARLECTWRDKDDLFHAEFSMGRNFGRKEILSAGSSHTHNFIYEIEDTWDNYKAKRDAERTLEKRIENLVEGLSGKIEDINLEVSASEHELSIYGDYDRFEKLLMRIGE